MNSYDLQELVTYYMGAKFHDFNANSLWEIAKVKACHRKLTEESWHSRTKMIFSWSYSIFEVILVAFFQHTSALMVKFQFYSVQDFQIESAVRFQKLCVLSSRTMFGKSINNHFTNSTRLSVYGHLTILVFPFNYSLPWNLWVTDTTLMENPISMQTVENKQNILQTAKQNN